MCSNLLFFRKKGESGKWLFEWTDEDAVIDALNTEFGEYGFEFKYEFTPKFEFNSQFKSKLKSEFEFTFRPHYEFSSNPNSEWEEINAKLRNWESILEPV